MKRRFEAHIGPGSRLLAVLKRVWIGAYHDGMIHAGNLAYMAILSLFPFFITVAAIFSLIGEQAQRTASIDAFLLAVPPVVAKVIGPVAREVVAARSGWLLWLGGVVGLWTVGSLIETIREILRRAYGTPVPQMFLRHRLIATGMIFAAVILLLFSLFAQVAITGVQEVIAAWFPGFDQLANALAISRFIPALVLYCSMFLLFLTLTPRAFRGKHNPKWPGALLVTLWWVAVTLLLPSVLRAFFVYDLTYGSLAGVMIALFFFWLVGLGMVVGAELNAALAQCPTSRDMPERDMPERDMIGQADNRERDRGARDGDEGE